MKTKDAVRIPYQPPHLEQHSNYTLVTGLSVTFDFANFEDPLLENPDFLGGADQ